MYVNAGSNRMVKLGRVKQEDGIHDSLDNFTHLVHGYLPSYRTFLVLPSRSDI